MKILILADPITGDWEWLKKGGKTLDESIEECLTYEAPELKPNKEE